jgi:hypothetical protein
MKILEIRSDQRLRCDDRLNLAWLPRSLWWTMPLVRIPTDRDRRFRGIVTVDSELA